MHARGRGAGRGVMLRLLCAVAALAPVLLAVDSLRGARASPVALLMGSGENNGNKNRAKHWQLTTDTSLTGVFEAAGGSLEGLFNVVRMCGSYGAVGSSPHDRKVVLMRNIRNGKSYSIAVARNNAPVASTMDAKLVGSDASSNIVNGKLSGMDCAFEALSGEAVAFFAATAGGNYLQASVVGPDATGKPTASALSTGVRDYLGAEVHELCAATRPTSDEIIVAMTVGSRDTKVMLWNGASLTTSGNPNLPNSANDLKYRSCVAAQCDTFGIFCFVFFCQSSPLLSLSYRQRDANTWRNTATISPPAVPSSNKGPRWIATASHPSMQRVCVGVVHYDGGAWAAVGTPATATTMNWVKSGMFAAGDDSDRKQIGVAFETQSGRCMVAVGHSSGGVAYARSDATATSWSGFSNVGVTTFGIRHLTLDSNKSPASNRVALLVYHKNSFKLELRSWSGSAWTSVSLADAAEPQVPNEQVDDDQPIALLYDRPAPPPPPTPPPTDTPTKAPTDAPSATPTTAPSRSPTVSPTPRPTLAPSAAPTKSPSRAPTKAPTRSPTRSPTTSPSPAPSRSPTPQPTTTPGAPSRSPTVSPPTASPTAAPSPSPTTSPTTAPSSSPSRSPTPSPTPPPGAPTRSPTPRPTDAPTVAPTASPVIGGGAAAPSGGSGAEVPSSSDGGGTSTPSSASGGDAPASGDAPAPLVAPRPGLPVPIIAGAAAGACCLLLLLLFVCCLTVRRRRKRLNRAMMGGSHRDSGGHSMRARSHRSRSNTYDEADTGDYATVSTVALQRPGGGGRRSRRHSRRINGGSLNIATPEPIYAGIDSPPSVGDPTYETVSSTLAPTLKQGAAARSSAATAAAGGAVAMGEYGSLNQVTGGAGGGGGGGGGAGAAGSGASEYAAPDEPLATGDSGRAQPIYDSAIVGSAMGSAAGGGGGAAYDRVDGGAAGAGSGNAGYDRVGGGDTVLYSQLPGNGVAPAADKVNYSALP